MGSREFALSEMPNVRERIRFRLTSIGTYVDLGWLYVVTFSPQLVTLKRYKSVPHFLHCPHALECFSSDQLICLMNEGPDCPEQRIDAHVGVSRRVGSKFVRH